MARQVNKLSARLVKSLSERGRYGDGNGLYLQISKQGSKSWLYRFRLFGRSREMGLGAVNTITLAEARQHAEECRKLVQEGLDPINAREKERRDIQSQNARFMSFDECTDAFLSDNSDGWKNAKHVQQWLNTLQTYAFPVFGKLPVQDIDIDLIIKVLRPIWTTKTETASRVRGRIEKVLSWATVRKFRDGPNPAQWRGNLDALLPAPSKVKQVRHHPALPYQDVGTFISRLRTKEGWTARGLEFQILTAARTGEVLGAKWEEIDLTAQTWSVPAVRMKNKKEHVVPLSPQLVSLIEALPRIEGSAYLFPNSKGIAPLSNMAFAQLVKRMGYSNRDVTVHGFRSTFRDWASEQTNFASDVAEKALSHTIKNKVEAAYRRGDLLEKRRRLMSTWADYCDRVRDNQGSQVVSIKKKLASKRKSENR